LSSTVRMVVDDTALCMTVWSQDGAATHQYWT